MKFSVVIPTRNRLEYLKSTIFSVLHQDFDDWQLIISDNASSEKIQEYVSSLNEPRIKYSRSEEFLSVTKNWNRAVDMSSGDYVILLGDDDCLMPKAFSTLVKIIQEFSDPELIFANGLLYVYPGVFGQTPEGSLTTIGNWNLWKSEVPVRVERDQMKKLANEARNFRLLFSYNMQVMTIHRKLIERLKHQGQFFHSPYPDFYAMTLLMQQAETTIGCPYPLAIVGLSPKSFGGLFFNNNEKKSIDELNIEREINQYPELDKVILPGTKFNTCWLYALFSVQKNFPSTSSSEINVTRYRELQLFESLRAMKNMTHKFAFFTKILSRLSLQEKIKLAYYLLNRWEVKFLRKFLGKRRFRSKLEDLRNIHIEHVNYKFKENYSSILDVFNKLTPLECKHHFLNDIL
jgi:glycosyltransferase involved in cell wall biosynthesis